jgi:peptide/nickel transport system ATP-binding protein
LTAATQTPVLEAVELEIEYTTAEGCVRPLDGATLSVPPGAITAVVGESGSGKTTLGLAAGRLLATNAIHVGGDLRVLGERVLECDTQTLRMLRADVLGFIFQDPVAALDPTMRVRRQMELVARRRDEATVEEALREVGLSDITRVLRAYPHELSGGMAQRVGIAIALLRRPRLLIADEPTAAVDATRRAQILALLVDRCRTHECALLLLTHDLHNVSRWSTHIAVMYGGRVVETGVTRQVLRAPLHPYTRALLSSVPGGEQPGERLGAIPGRPPVLRGPSEGCAFAPRCADVLDRCSTTRPLYAGLGQRHVCCHLVGSEAESSDGRTGDTLATATSNRTRNADGIRRRAAETTAAAPGPTTARPPEGASE